MDWHVDTTRFLGPRHTERHLRLTEAAIAVFAEKGLADTSINDITTRAGVARTQFYFAWEDKYDCFSFCHQLSVAEAERRIETRVGTSSAWRKTLFAGIEAVVELMENGPDLARLVLLEGPLSGRESDLIVRHRAEKRLEDALLTLYREITPDEVEVTPRMARMAIGAARAMLLAYLDAPDLQASSLAADLVVALLSLGLGPVRAQEMATTVG